MSYAVDQKGLQRDLSQRCERAGSQSAVARQLGVSVSQVNEAVNGKRDVSQAMANAMGYIRVDRFLLVRPAKEPVA